MWRRECIQMVTVLIYLIPLIIGSIAMPTWILLVVLLLSRSHRILEAVSFVAGVTAVRLAQGIIFGGILSVYSVPAYRKEMGIVASIFLILTGILLWLAAAREWRKAPRPEAPLPRWLSLVSSLTPLRTFVVGALLVLTSTRAWLFTLAAASLIGQANLRPLQDVIAYLYYVIGANLLIVTPIVISLTSSAHFEAGAHWLELHNRSIVIAVSAIVGSIFLWRGIAGIAGALMSPLSFD
jgi:Sap, sulfolipid-1-addressing protein